MVGEWANLIGRRVELTSLDRGEDLSSLDRGEELTSWIEGGITLVDWRRGANLIDWKELTSLVGGDCPPWLPVEIDSLVTPLTSLVDFL